MSVVHARFGAPFAAVAPGKDEPGVQLRALRLVASIWSRRQAGALVVPGLDNRPTRRLLFADGALADRMAFMYLNAALHRGDLRFEEMAVPGRSDRSALGRLLMERGRLLGRQQHLMAFDRDFVLLLDAAAIHELGVGSSCVALFASHPVGALPLALLTSAQDDEALMAELKALMLLGFVAPREICSRRGDAATQSNLGERAAPRSVVRPSRTASSSRPCSPLESLNPEESLEDQSSVLIGSVVNERALDRCAAVYGDDDVEGLLLAARAHMRRHDWLSARDLLVEGHARRFDHARILAYLGVVSLFLPNEDRADAIVRARRYSETAIALDPSDTVVRRLARQIERHSQHDLTNDEDLESIEPSNVAALSLA